MEKKNLSNLLEGKIFCIPDYQRGYAWEQKQWNDFLQDIDALIDEKIKSHYTGTIVIYPPKDEQLEYYGINRLELVDIVDGQQRLTTCSLYLAIIIRKLVESGEKGYSAAITTYLYSGAQSKLRLNNDTADFFYGLVSKGSTNVQATTVHQKRLYECYQFLKSHIEEQLAKREAGGVRYLKDLFDAIDRKLNFSFYTIEDESEIGMTFELMNSRGKDLSSLELLKNYLMHWIYRNAPLPNDKKDLTKIVNNSWKSVYTNIASCNGSEDQCLRVVWILYHSHTPKHWQGYAGFKADNVIPLRNFLTKTKDDTQEFIVQLSKGLAEISHHYNAIIKPSKDSGIKDEFKWLSKIANAGNMANYLPLIIAVRQNVCVGEISSEKYIDLLKSLELFSYRVFLWSDKRSHTGKSNFYRWAHDFFHKKYNLDSILEEIAGLVNYHSNESGFRKNLQDGPNDWYSHWHHRRLLKYTLYEYELWLLEFEGKSAAPKLAWSDLNDASLEHILPQSPENNSAWRKQWSDSEMDLYLHDISNIVLTRDNPNYRNFDFARKKGVSGAGHCYANSDIRQERKISEFDDWTPANCQKRREDLVSWILDRWGRDDAIAQAATIRHAEHSEEDEYDD